jgi:co-chaperonin GroES (HSP10)
MSTVTTEHTLFAVGHKIVVRMDEAPQESQGGIHIPSDARPERYSAEVLSVGSFIAETLGYDLQRGEKILVNSYDIHTLELDGIRYGILEPNQVLAIVNNEH